MEGDVAFITGGAGGLGRGFAEILLKQGAKVCITDINEECGQRAETELQKQCPRGQILFLKCDVTAQDEFEEAIKTTKTRFGKLNILVNNAGILNEHKPEETMRVNLEATFYGTNLGLKYVDTGGVIINNSSLASLLPQYYLPAYSASKHGVTALSRAIGMTSQQDRGIRVNCLNADATETELFTGSLRKQSLLPQSQLNEMFKDYVPLKVAEVAEGFLKLIQADVSGKVMVVTRQYTGFLDLPTTIEGLIEKYT